MSEADSSQRPDNQTSPGTDIVPVQPENIGEILLSNTDILLSAGSALHPTIVPNVDAKQFDGTAEKGEKFYVAVKPYEKAGEAEADMLDDRPYHRLGLRFVGGGIVKTRYGDLARSRPLIARTPEELTAKIEVQKLLQTKRAELIEASPLGEGIIVLTNEFGGIDIRDDHLELTAQDLVLRAMIARVLEAKDVGNLVEMGLLDDHVAKLFGGSIASVFKDMDQNLGVLEQLPEAALKAAGPPILEHLVAETKKYVERLRFPLQALSIALHNKEDVRGLFELVRDYKPPTYDKDYDFDAMRLGKQGYRGTKITNTDK